MARYVGSFFFLLRSLSTPLSTNVDNFCGRVVETLLFLVGAKKQTTISCGCCFFICLTRASTPPKSENPQAYSAAGLWVFRRITEDYSASLLFSSSSTSSSSSSSSSSSMASKRSSTILDRASILSSSAGRNSSYSPLTTIFMI